MLSGARYRPVLKICPICGLMDHVTAVLDSPTTVAENCCVSPPVRRVTVRGFTVMATWEDGMSVTCAVPDWFGSATLTTLTVTVCRAVMGTGATYNPVLSMLPRPCGEMDQVTA